MDSQVNRGSWFGKSSVDTSKDTREREREREKAVGMWRESKSVKYVAGKGKYNVKTK